MTYNKCGSVTAQLTKSLLIDILAFTSDTGVKQWAYALAKSMKDDEALWVVRGPIAGPNQEWIDDE